MNYKETAASIIKYVGGWENVSHLEHCSTRLRFTLFDMSKANLDELKKTKGVLGIVTTAQLQIIIGNSVVEAYDEVMKLKDNASESSKEISNDDNKKEVKKEKLKLGAFILDFIVGVFQPLIPPMAGAGVFKSILLLIAMTGILDKDSNTYTIFVFVSDAVFFFLPILVADSVASKLKVNKLVAISCVSVLLFPQLTTMINEGASLFSIKISPIQYSSQVFPAILCVVFYSFIEKLFTKISPKPIRIFFVPMMSLAITSAVTLLILGPIGYFFGKIFTACILFIYNTIGFIALGILAAFLPFMVATGMHKALIPYALSSYSQLGMETLYLPASLAHNISEGAACFGVALRTKNQELKSTAISAGISAIFGITEPALYGVNLQHKRALLSVIIGSVVGGIVVGVLHLKAFAVVGPGLASLPMFIDPNNHSNIIYAIIGLIVSFLTAFISALILWKDEKIEK